MMRFNVNIRFCVLTRKDLASVTLQVEGEKKIYVIVRNI